eukprot:5924564-Alexandrium_andersonii.AAC.1
MSASLVGSEMCIRDRNAQRVKQPSPRLGIGESSRPTFHRTKRKWRRASPCLLYTSDAADDM